MTLNADGLKQNYPYQINIDEQKYTDSEAENNILKAQNEIDESFYSKGDSPEHVTGNVSMAEVYVNGSVSAEWTLSDYEAVTTEGEIIQKELDEQGRLITAEVELECNDIKRVYTFSFVVFPKELNREEQLLKDIGDEIDVEMQKKGAKELMLPQKVNGTKLNWSSAKEHMVVKVFFFEIIIVVLLVLVQKEKEKERIRKQQESLKLDYSELVSKLAILMGSGMSVKQAWNRISARYLTNKQKFPKMKRPIYEEMLITMHEIEDGISERIAYQRFGERIGLGEYHRFCRLLIQNMQKGNRGICMVLESEAIDAYEQRRLLAKKIGEEAGTKMLIPLMLMMVIVISIVVVPAVLSF